MGKRVMARIFHLVLAVGMLVNGVACTMVGKGTRTVIKEQRVINKQDRKAVDFIRKRYPHLLAHPDHGDDKNIVFFGRDGRPGSLKRSLRIGKSRLPRLSKSPQSLRSAFSDYMEAKYGDADFEAARLTFGVRDRGKTPAFLPTDAVALAAKNTAAIIAADPKLTPEDAIRRENLLKARLLNTADLPQTTTVHHTDKKGRDIYYYYPRLDINFSSELLSATNLDRFSFLGLVIALESGESETYGCSTLRPRFIDFTPKAADFATFTRGTLTQNSQIQARAAYGSTQNSTLTTASPGGGTTPSTVAGLTRSLSLDGGGSYTYSEAVVRELRDAIQRRSIGIDDQGQVFFAEYRSINAIRIGGTYNFDLMLEVPAYGRDNGDTWDYESAPVTKEIRANIYLVGVIRHVYDRGETGLLLHYPEAENDHVYEQVVLRVYDKELLWKFNGSPWMSKSDGESDGESDEEAMFTLTVVSNHADARFVVKRESGEEDAYLPIQEVTCAGDGCKTECELPIEEDYSARVEFLPIGDTSARSDTVVLKATASPEIFTVRQNGGEKTIVGTYGP